MTTRRVQSGAPNSGSMTLDASIRIQLMPTYKPSDRKTSRRRNSLMKLFISSYALRLLSGGAASRRSVGSSRRGPRARPGVGPLPSACAGVHHAEED